MKKATYTPPRAESVTISFENMLAGSTLTTDGSQNISITPSDGDGDGGYTGSFQSHRRGWNSDDWAAPADAEE